MFSKYIAWTLTEITEQPYGFVVLFVVVLFAVVVVESVSFRKTGVIFLCGKKRHGRSKTPHYKKALLKEISTRKTWH